MKVWVVNEFSESFQLLGTTTYKNKPNWAPKFNQQISCHEVIENEVIN